MAKVGRPKGKKDPIHDALQRFAKGKKPKKTHAEYQREWRKKHPEQYKNTDYKNKFGISLEQYELMFKQQNGVCAICGKPETQKLKTGVIKRLAVDHNHNTNKVRGLLCSSCNRALGYFEENTCSMLLAIKYLEQHTEK